ncbi:MAG: hypothetical protein FJW39_29910 [Acidobacteria bacterium]|nr:hypothetical protein [Acidobacteriota bacterium]
MLFKHSFVRLITLSMTLAAGVFAQPGFTVRDLRGTYAFSFQGTLVRIATNTPIPVAAVGVFTLDGEGKVTKGTRILNVAGQVVRETATGTYTINSEGVGTATFTVIPIDGEPQVVPPTREVFHFTMTNRRTGAAISGSILAANGQDIGLISIVKSDFVRQEEP